jgi:hypothetical protein
MTEDLYAMANPASHSHQPSYRVHGKESQSWQ